MRIGIDVDGVLANFTKGYAQVIRQTSGRDLLTDELIEAPTSWYWDRYAGYTKDEENTAWNHINQSPYFWSELSCLKGIQDIQFLVPGHDVYFITTRTGVDPKRQTEEFLNSYLHYTPTVLVSANKGPLAAGLDLDVFIDDRDKNIWEVAEASPRTQCYILDYPYNRNVQDTTNIHRVYSVKQALEESGAQEYNYN